MKNFEEVCSFLFKLNNILEFLTLKNKAMKFLKLLFLLIILSTFAACGDDDDNCSKADWIGTYTGTIEYLTHADSIEDVTLTVTPNGSDLVIFKYKTTSTEEEFIPLKPQDCFAGANLNPSGSEIINILANLLKDQDRLTFNLEQSMGGIILVNYQIDVIRD